MRLERGLVQVALSQPGSFGDLGGGLFEAHSVGHKGAHLREPGFQAHGGRFGARENERNFAPDTFGGPNGKFAERSPLDLFKHFGELPADDGATIRPKNIAGIRQRIADAVGGLEKHHGARFAGQLSEECGSFPVLAGKKTFKGEAIGGQTGHGERRNDGTRAGQGGYLNTRGRGGFDEMKAGITHGGHARVAEHENVGFAREFKNLERLITLIVIVQGNQSRAVFDTESAQEFLRGASVFAGDDGHRAEHLHEATRNIAEIANGSCSKNDHASSLALPSLARIPL